MVFAFSLVLISVKRILLSYKEKKSDMINFIHFSNSKVKFMFDSEYAVVGNRLDYCMGDNPHYSTGRYPKMSERAEEDRVIVASLSNHPMLSLHLNFDAKKSEMTSHKFQIRDDARVFVHLFGERSITCSAREAREAVERLHQENLSTSPSYANIIIYIPIGSLCG